MYNERPIEMGLKGREIEVLARFTRNAAATSSGSAWHSRARSRRSRLTNIIKAIASFERVLVSADSAFDRYLYQDDRRGMSPSARRGVAPLFFRLACVAANAMAASTCRDPRFLRVRCHPIPRRSFTTRASRPSPASFRAPTLRNIAVTAPYMHDGSIWTLRGRHPALLRAAASRGLRRATASEALRFHRRKPTI